MSKKLYVKKLFFEKYELCAPRTSFPLTFPFFHPSGQLSIVHYQLSITEHYQLKKNGSSSAEPLPLL